MQFSFFTKCLLALATASTVLAQTPQSGNPTPGFDVFTAPAQGSTLVAGSTFNIQWTPSAPAGKISILLLAGATQQSLQLGPTIATSIDSTLGTFAWTVVPKAADLYGLKLQLDSNTTIFQYSYPFIISGGSVSSGTTNSTVKTTSTTPATTSISTTTLPVTSTSTTILSTGINSNSTLAATQASPSSSGPGSQTSSSTSSSSTAKASGGAICNTPASAAGILGAIAVAVAML